MGHIIIVSMPKFYNVMLQVKSCIVIRNVILSCTGVAKRHANRLLQEFPDLKVTFEGTPYYLPGLLRDSDR